MRYNFIKYGKYLTFFRYDFLQYFMKKWFLVFILFEEILKINTVI